MQGVLVRNRQQGLGGRLDKLLKVALAVGRLERQQETGASAHGDKGQGGDWSESSEVEARVLLWAMLKLVLRYVLQAREERKGGSLPACGCLCKPAQRHLGVRRSKWDTLGRGTPCRWLHGSEATE